MGAALIEDSQTFLGNQQGRSEKSSRAECVTTIRPRSGLTFIDFGELWRYRELLFFLPGVMSKYGTSGRSWVCSGR